MLTKHFSVRELLPPGYTDVSVFDAKLLQLIDQVRDLLGVPCTINAGERIYCGWRPQDCPIGAPHSLHKLGKAADLHPQGMSAEDARTLLIKADASGLVPLLGRMEGGVSWLHVDVGPRKNGRVHIFNA